MIYTTLKKEIEKIFFIIYKEKYTNENNNSNLERMVCKHPLLRPEIILVNDQPQGFKKTSKKIASLEKFPIFIEIESDIEEDFEDHINSEETIILNFELYTEIMINCQNHLTDIIYLSNIFNKTINIDRIINIENTDNQSLNINSKLGQYIQENKLFPDKKIKSNFIQYNKEKHKKSIQIYLNSFCNFIKILDDILIKKMKIKDLNTIFEHH